MRTIAVSTGKPSTPTPPGDYHVYAKIPRWWSTPFREWLPWALPFVGGIAFHEFADVPVYPASHGCVRQSYDRRALDVRLRERRHAGQGDREVVSHTESNSSRSRPRVSPTRPGIARIAMSVPAT